MLYYLLPQAAFSHWILFSQTEMRADLPRVQTRLGVSSSSSDSAPSVSPVSNSVSLVSMLLRSGWDLVTLLLCLLSSSSLLFVSASSAWILSNTFPVCLRPVELTGGDTFGTDL